MYMAVLEVGALSVDQLFTRALLFGIHIKAPDVGTLPYTIKRADPFKARRWQLYRATSSSAPFAPLGFKVNPWVSKHPKVRPTVDDQHFACPNLYYIP